MKPDETVEEDNLSAVSEEASASFHGGTFGTSWALFCSWQTPSHCPCCLSMPPDGSCFGAAVILLAVRQSPRHISSMDFPFESHELWTIHNAGLGVPKCMLQYIYIYIQRHWMCWMGEHPILPFNEVSGCMGVQCLSHERAVPAYTTPR